MPLRAKLDILHRIYRRILTQKGTFLLLLACSTVLTLFSLFVPWWIGGIIDSITTLQISGRMGLDRLLGGLAMLALAFLLMAGLSYLQGIFSARLSQSTAAGLRKSLFEKLLAAPVQYTDTHTHGDLMSRVTNDVENISALISQLLSALITGIIAIVGCIAILFSQNAVLALVNLGAAAISIILPILVSGPLLRLFRKQQQSLGKMNHQVKESAADYRSVIAYNKQEDEIRNAFAQSDRLMHDSARAQILMGILEPLMMVSANLSFLAVAVAGGYLTLSGLISLGVMQSSILYARQFLKTVNDLGSIINQLQSTIACAERVFEVLDEQDEPEGGNSLDKAALSGVISVRDVSFAYTRRKKVLDHLSFDIAPGQTVAIVGATGVGKTTLASLLLRFYEPDEGSISIGGVDIASFPKRFLRRNCAIVLQDASLMSDTVKNNIAYGRGDATLQMVEESAEKAHAHGFIGQLRNGYDTLLKRGGSTLSIGQRQLICIARVLLMDPKIIIFDEAMSSVDTRTERLVRSAMEAMMKNRTCIIIAHRLSTIRNADSIIMLKDGKVAEMGRHDDLIALRGEYYNLYRNQFI
jgi:ATP-binding cassette subfamily B protein